MKNFYEILNVKQTATTQEIKTAYLKLIKKYHPDTFGGDKNFAKEQTERITEAYATLKDEEKRKIYDLKLPKKQEKANQTKVDNFIKKVKFINEKNEKKKSIKPKEKKVKESKKDNSQENPSNILTIAIIVLSVLLVGFLIMCFV